MSQIAQHALVIALQTIAILLMPEFVVIITLLAMISHLLILYFTMRKNND